MKPFVQAMFIGLWSLTALAPAAGTKADLKKMMAQLDKKWDGDLNEKVIKLGAALKPPIPEEARKAFIIGESLFKQAKGIKGAYDAARSFDEAEHLAPWWGDAYWDEALARQLAGQPGFAKEALRLYLLTKPSAADRRKAQDKIYSIEADILAVTSNQSPGLAGFWQQNGHQKDGQWIEDSTDSASNNVYEFRPSGSVYEIICVRCESVWTCSFAGGQAGKIAFNQTYHGSNGDTVINHDCSYENGVMTCVQTTNSDNDKYIFRMIKRNACEVVGGPGLTGYYVLCK